MFCQKSSSLSLCHFCISIKVIVFILNFSIFINLTQSQPQLLRNYQRNDLIWFYQTRMRRAEPDCAAKVHGNPEAVNTVVDIFTSTKKSAPILNYLNNVDQEFKEVYEDCGTEDYFQEPKTDVMGDMAQADRALCPFTTYLDVDPQRIPKAITKVKCLCNRPKKGKFGENINTVTCEKVFYEMTVLKFSESCGSYKEETEKLVLACIPVFGSHRTIDPNVSKAKVESAPIQV